MAGSGSLSTSRPTLNTRLSVVNAWTAAFVALGRLVKKLAISMMASLAMTSSPVLLPKMGVITLSMALPVVAAKIVSKGRASVITMLPKKARSMGAGDSSIEE